jgi:glycosyltransferase involved in cell wall biosynthesis
VAPGLTRFLGHLDARALGDVLAASDVFVHPNPREPFGIGPLEAMAVGVPLVAPRAGGILSYANDDNAWLTNPGGDALAAGVQLALANDDERARRAAAARLTAERFHWKGSAARMLRRYDKIHWQRVTASGDRRCSLALSGAASDS